MPDHPRTPLPKPRTLGEFVIARWKDEASIEKSPPVTCCRSREIDTRLSVMGDPANHSGMGHKDAIHILRVTLDEGATLPSRACEHDAGLDLHPLSDILPRLMPQETRVFDTGVHVEIPVGYVGKIEGRSSLSRRGIKTSGGVIDSGYRGPIGVILTNDGQAQWVSQPGRSIAQLVLYPVAILTPMVVDSLGTTERGGKGFGSSDRMGNP